MRFYLGTRVGRAWIGTSMTPEEAAGAGVVYVAGVAAFLLILPPLALTAMWCLGILVQLLQHHYVQAVESLAILVGGWAVFIAVVTRAVRQKRRGLTWRRTPVRGWYQDPTCNDTRHLRWWDGKEWSKDQVSWRKGVDLR